MDQLTKMVTNKISDYEDMLKGEIRIVGLREKIVKRKATLTKALKVLKDHKE